MAGARSVLALLLATACGGAQTAPASFSSTRTITVPSQSTSFSNGSITPAQVAAMLSAKGVDCSGYHDSTTPDPGASAAGSCGSFPGVIEIAVFPTRDALTTTWLPFQRSFYCSGSGRPVGDSYVDGGSYAITTLDKPTIARIAAALGTPETSLC